MVSIEDISLRVAGRLLAGELVVAQMTDARGSSNLKARKELGWEPRYASWREGFHAWVTG